MAVSGILSGFVKMTAASDSITGKFFVKSIRWVGAAAAGHAAIVKQEDGQEIFDSEADGQYFLDIIPVYKWVTVITVDTLDSGRIYVNIA